MADLDDFFGGESDDNGNDGGVVFDPEILKGPEEDTPESGEKIVNDAQKRTMTIFLVIDTSYSMEGERIAQVNQAIAETIPMLQEVQRDQNGVVIQVAIMTFDSDAKWITPMPEPVERLTFSKIEKPTGGTYYGFAFDKLHEKMSRKAFMNSVGGHFQPLILLLSDGEPIDPEAWPAKLDRLYQSNMWFKASTRVAIGIGSDAKSAEATKVFKAFTNNKEMILYPSNLDELRNFIKLVTVHASKWNTSRNSQGTSEAAPSGGYSGGSEPDPIDNTSNPTPDWFQPGTGGITGLVDFPDLPGMN